MAKSISRTEAEEQEAARLVHETHERLVTKQPTRRIWMTSVTIRDNTTVTKKKTSEQSLKLQRNGWLSDAAIHEEDTRKVIKASKLDLRYQHHTGGSSEGAGSKPEVPDVSKAMSSDQESENESWGDSEDDDDDSKSDDERTESDDDKSIDLNKTDDEEEDQGDEFVHTPDDYVPTNDETHDVDNEEYKTSCLTPCMNPSSFNKHPANKTLYHALMESLIADEDAIDQEVSDLIKHKKRPHDDEDRDQDSPAVRSGLKKRKTSDDTQPSKRPKSTDTEMPLNQGNDMGDADEQLNVKTITKDDWFKKPARPPTPDPEWNKGKSVDNEPAQTWLNDLANAEKPPFTFNELMSTPINFSTFAMNHWNNLEGNRCPYDLSKPLPLQEIRGCLNVPANFFFNNDLEYLRGGSTDIKYMASTTKTKAAKYDMEGISHWGPKCQRFYGYVINRKSRHDVYSTIRILSVTSVTVEEWYGYGYLKEIIVRRVDQKLYKFMEGDFPRLHLNDIEDIAPYTTLSIHQGMIYEDKLKRKRFMRTEELYKFSDGTLNPVRNTLDQRLKNIKLGYNKVIDRMKWTTIDQKQTRIMIKDINQQLLHRRIIRSLEKFVGGRDYRTDYRLLQRTI
ncbi:hypothetical protein Tco_0779478 [Tanacetum coccineum]